MLKEAEDAGQVRGVLNRVNEFSMQLCSNLLGAVYLQSAIADMVHQVVSCIVQWVHCLA